MVANTPPFIYVVTCRAHNYDAPDDPHADIYHLACAFINEAEAHNTAARIRQLHDGITDMKEGDERQNWVVALRRLDSAYEPGAAYEYTWVVEGAPMPTERHADDEPRGVPQPTGVRAMVVE